MTMRNILLRPAPITRPQMGFEFFLGRFAAAMDEQSGRAITGVPMVALPVHGLRV